MARVLRVIALVLFVSVLFMGCEKKSDTEKAVDDAAKKVDKEAAEAVEKVTK